METSNYLYYRSKETTANFQLTVLLWYEVSQTGVITTVGGGFTIA